MRENRKCILIFSGYNQRAVISFCRVCHQYNIPYKMVSAFNDTIQHTTYKRNIVYKRKNSSFDLELFKNIREIIDDYNEIVILPSSEYINRFILKNRTTLENMGFEIPLVEQNLYNLISDKYSFGELCIKNGINIPREINSKDVEQFPIVVKPKKYFCRNKKIISPIIIKDKSELEEALNKIDLADIYIQEFVQGESYYLLYYFSQNAKVVSFSQKNILQQDGGKSIIAARTSKIHLEDIGNKFINLFENISYKGLVMVELKKYNNKFYMIEANPRLWGPSQLFIDSNVNLFELFIKELGFNVNIDKKDVNYNALYFWEGGISQLEKEDRNLVYYGEFKQDDKTEYRKYDIYNRTDTKEIYNMEMNKEKKVDIKELRSLYEDGSKHSVYQNIPQFVSERIGYKVQLDENWRGDETRLKYIEKFLKNINYNSIGDIGANTGYFSLSLANEMKNKKVISYEINKNHVDFISTIKENFDLKNIQIINEGVNLEKVDDLKELDIYMLLNVIHHAGVDFDVDLGVNNINFKQYAKQYLEKLRNKCRVLIFQMGYNHGGNKLNPIVSPNEIKEMFDYHLHLIRETGWNIVDVAYAANNDKQYKSLLEYGISIDKLNTYDLKLLDKYIEKYDICNNSEFYKRPIFILCKNI
ncbi:DUF1698 domain-containing protein [Terrisporobacter petrolearius]|uniref:ATP-grasp domain-containing protein n=1 Tax=Terrisporobacter petrolearius TaxID=1460447 RepID=UPI001D164565|nr:ATP-grasp domain-containing protein [Terrisporobacter petrolearius]MCC3862837.1 DUF1698 domain-containing protein [Terrisporobacter petrolearius]